MYKRILASLGGSPLSEGILSPHAQPLMKNEEVEFVLLRVPVNPVVEFSFSPPSIAENVTEKTEFGTKEYISDLPDKLETAGFRVSFLIHEKPIWAASQIGRIDHSQKLMMSVRPYKEGQGKKE